MSALRAVSDPAGRILRRDADGLSLREGERGPAGIDAATVIADFQREDLLFLHDASFLEASARWSGWTEPRTSVMCATPSSRVSVLKAHAVATVKIRPAVTAPVSERGVARRDLMPQVHVRIVTCEWRALRAVHVVWLIQLTPDIRGRDSDDDVRLVASVLVLVFRDVTLAVLVIAEGVLVTRDGGVECAGGVVPLRLARIFIRVAATWCVFTSCHYSSFLQPGHKA